MPTMWPPTFSISSADARIVPDDNGLDARPIRAGRRRLALLLLG
jgi:hypothetical protein